MAEMRVAREKKAALSVHVLDISKGLPVGQVPVSLQKFENEEWRKINTSQTNSDGRCEDLIGTGSSASSLGIGRFKICFNVEQYFLSTRTPALYPYIDVVFDVRNSQETFHLPLLLSPFGYNTYRGS